MDLDHSALTKSVDALKRALALHDDAPVVEADLRMVLRSACIKNFEISYELAWKCLRRWLILTQDAERVENLYSRADLFRMAAQHGVIADPTLWISFHHARNHGAHIYHEEIAQRSFTASRNFVATARQLIEFLVAHRA